MSTAVLISGQMRTAKKCAESILRAFPGADFYVCTEDDENAGDAELFKPKRLLLHASKEMPERREYSWQIGRSCGGVQACLKQLSSLKKMYQLYCNSGDVHDWIVRCRPDVDFTFNPESESDRNGDLMVPTFCNYFGLNDRFAMMRPSIAADYFCRFDRLDEYTNLGGVFQMETFLWWAVSSKCFLTRTHTVFCTVRANSREGPVWRKEFGDIVPE